MVMGASKLVVPALTIVGSIEVVTGTRHMNSYSCQAKSNVNLQK